MHNARSVCHSAKQGMLPLVRQAAFRPPDESLVHVMVGNRRCDGGDEGITVLNDDAFLLRFQFNGYWPPRVRLAQRTAACPTRTLSTSGSLEVRGGDGRPQRAACFAAIASVLTA